MSHTSLGSSPQLIYCVRIHWNNSFYRNAYKWIRIGKCISAHSHRCVWIWVFRCWAEQIWWYSLKYIYIYLCCVCLAWLAININVDRVQHGILVKLRTTEEWWNCVLCEHQAISVAPSLIEMMPKRICCFKLKRTATSASAASDERSLMTMKRKKMNRIEMKSIWIMWVVRAQQHHHTPDQWYQ